MSKLKVVWLTSINASSVKEDILFYNPKEKNSLVPWITLLTDEFRKHTDEISLSIISTFTSLKEDVHFSVDGIDYHFITQRFKPFKRALPYRLRNLTGFDCLNRKVKKLVDYIHPDVVHLFGAEHDLSNAFFVLKQPLLLTVNWYVFSKFRYSPSGYYKSLMQIEKKIYEKAMNVNIKAQFMEEIARKFNPDVRLYWFNYIINKPKVKADDYPEKDADIVYAARLEKNKGIEDLIAVVSKLKDKYPRLRVKIIGPAGNPQYLQSVMDMIEAGGMAGNFRYLGFIDDKQEMYAEMAKSLLYVLPTHFDIMPYTVLESMFIGIPVVAYRVAGIPDLNLERTSCLLCEPGDIDSLTAHIERLLNEPALRRQLVENASLTVSRKYDNEVIYHEMMDSYRDVIEKYMIS